MCGLVGYFGKGKVHYETVFKDLLQLGMIRGPHSTGVLFVRENDKEKCRVVKDSVLPIDLIDTREFSDNMAPFNKVLMGHNRWATRGAILKRNAHPFVCGNVIGAHNGTLHSVYDIDGLKYDTDSEAIFHYINNHGIKDTWKKLDGPAAITFWDRQASTMNLVRNKERPLFFSYTSEGDGVFWASESWMLHGAAMRNGLKLENVFELPADTAMVFEKEGDKVGHETVKLECKPPFVLVSATGFGRSSRRADRNRRMLSIIEGTRVDKEGITCIFCYDEIKDVSKAQQIDIDCYVCASCSVCDRQAGSPLIGH